MPSRTITRLGISRSFQVAQIFPSLHRVREHVRGRRHRPRAATACSARALTPLRCARDDRRGRSRHRAVPDRALPRRAGRDAAAGRAQAARHRHGGGRPPRVLLLDEPTSGISVEEKFGLMDVVMSALKTRRHHRAVRRARHGDRRALRRPGAGVLRRHRDRRRHARRSRSPTPQVQTLISGTKLRAGRARAPPCLRSPTSTSRSGRSPIIRDASLDLDEGEMCGLIGRNGAGKTTLLRALMGALPATGKAELGHVDLLALPAHRRVGHGIGYMPEDRRLVPEFTVEENIRCRPGRPRSTAREQRLDWIFSIMPEVANFRAPPRARTVRRPAEDGGARARADGRHAPAAARRAVRGPRAGAGAPARRGDGEPQGRGRVDPDRRIERGATSPTCSRAPSASSAARWRRCEREAANRSLGTQPNHRHV